MIVAHLPAGYLFAHLLHRKWVSGALFAGVVIGAVLPDLDMLWFHLVDNRQHHHHSYATHWPLTWIAIGLAGWMVARIASSAAMAAAAIGLAAGAVFHIALDSIAGHIQWFAPFSRKGFHLVDVPAIHSNWVVSFLLHWTFAVELAVVALAAFVFFSQIKRRHGRVAPSRH